jgi:hypothetical protein
MKAEHLQTGHWVYVPWLGKLRIEAALPAVDHPGYVRLIVGNGNEIDIPTGRDLLYFNGTPVIT